MEEVSVVVRWAHLFLGITWIGMLYYFNFVQGGFFNVNSPSLRNKYKTSYAGLTPAKLRWFRWAAGILFISAIYILWKTNYLWSNYIFFSALMSLCMLINVLAFIWPAQQIALGLRKGDRIASSDRAFSALRTNHLFCIPICLCLIASLINGNESEELLTSLGSPAGSGLFIALLIIMGLELNILFGKQLSKFSQQAFAQTSVIFAGVLFIVLTFI